MNPYRTARTSNHRTRGSVEEPFSWTLVVALILLAALAAWAWSAWPSPAPDPHPPTFFGLIDVSGSFTEPELRRALQAMNAALPERGHLTLAVFGRTARTVYAGSAANQREIYEVEDEILHHPPEPPGTRPDAALRLVLPAAQRAAARGEPVAVLLLWDGDTEDLSALKKAARPLAALPTLKAFWIIGVESTGGLRDTADRLLRPVLGDRLVMSGAYGGVDALERFEQLLNGS